MDMKKCFLLALLNSFVILMGCESTQSLYYHGNYNQALYNHFKGNVKPLPEQIAEFEYLIQKAKTQSKQVAPGIYAHLGYLYLQLGNDKKGLHYLQLEKRYFPESQAYINFLEKKVKGAK
tara:strand:- start:2954 stop:3313 length:360 start_codon:yes stop_codon:yes gene_type:complete